MEPRFGADFGGVRVHADAEAHQLNQDLSARAFTTGQDIFFKQGEYSPSSAGGQALLAHELTHVLQQGGTPSGVNPGAISSPGKRAVQRMMGRPKVQGGGGKKGGDGKENEKKGGEQKKPIFGEELLKARGAWEREMEEVQGWTIEAAQKLAWTTVKYTAYYLQKDQMPDENLTQLIQDCLDWHQLFSSMWEEIDQHWAILSENQAQFPEQERQRAIAWNTAVRAASSSMMQYVVSLLGFLQRIEAERAKTSHNLAKAAKSTSAALPPDWLNAQQSAIPGNVRLGTHLVQQGLSLADLLNVLHMMRSGSLPPPQQGNQMGQGSSSEGEE